MAIKGPGCRWRPLDYEYRVCMLVCLEVRNVCLSVHCVFIVRRMNVLCVHCVYGSFADDTLSAHGTLRVLQTAHLVYTVHCVLYKRGFLALVFSLRLLVTE